VPLEPTQLFEAAVELANFIFLMWLLKRRKFDGQVIGAFMFIYGVADSSWSFCATIPAAGRYLAGNVGTQLNRHWVGNRGGLIWWLRPGAKAVPAHPVEATR